jgi:dipeptidyl aminopeptidase/acylaminoacyl peptidase
VVVSYATVYRNKTAFMLVHGTADDIVDPAQTQQFWQALNQAGTYSRRIVIPGAGHFFASDPHDEPGSFAWRLRASCASSRGSSDRRA